MTDIPFKLLVTAHDRHPQCFVQPELKACKFLFPNDRPPMYSVPVASEYEACHALFEAESGRPLARPAGNYFVPLVDAALRLGDAFLWLLHHEAHLHDALLARGADWRWTVEPAFDVGRYLRDALGSIQSLVYCTQRIQGLLKDICNDPHDSATRSCPLTSYASVTAIQVMGYCKVALEQLGINGAITIDPTGPTGFDFCVSSDLAPMAPLEDGQETWPTQQALLFLEQREARLSSYIGYHLWLKAKAPSEEEFCARIDAMLSEGADEYARRMGAESPTGASGLEKFLAVTQSGPTVH
jgi:hypothetical protein